MNRSGTVLTAALTAILCCGVLDSSAYYDPKAGKWLSRDPIQEKGGINTTSFCRNDPVNNVDPLGLEANKLYGGGHVYEPRGGWWGYSNLDPSMSPWILSSEFDHLDGTFYDFPGDFAIAARNVGVSGTAAGSYWAMKYAVPALGLAGVTCAFAPAIARIGPVALRCGTVAARYGPRVARATFVSTSVSGGLTYCATDGDLKKTQSAMIAGLVTGPLFFSGALSIATALQKGLISWAGAVGAMTAIGGADAVMGDTIAQVAKQRMDGHGYSRALSLVDFDQQVAAGCLGLGTGAAAGGTLAMRHALVSGSARHQASLSKHVAQSMRSWRTMRHCSPYDTGTGLLNMYGPYRASMESIKSLTFAELVAIGVLDDAGNAMAKYRFLRRNWSSSPAQAVGQTGLPEGMFRPDLFGRNTVWVVSGDLSY